MKINNNLEKIWKRVPPDYYQKGIKTNILQRLWHRKKLETFISLTGHKRFHKILDIGCASGMMTNEISKTQKDSQIFGIDVYKEAIFFAKKKYPHINFRVADAHKLPFKSNFFNLCVCYETIEHVESPEKMLAEIKRVMRKNGRAIIAMDSGSPLFRVVWWFWEKTKGNVWQGAHLHPFTHDELEKVIKKTGFKVIKKHFSHLGMEVSFLLSK